MVPISVLDLAHVPEGSTPGDALRNSLLLAQTAERCGYRRYWLAEHHNMVGIASAATSVVIGHIAAGTHSIRVGAGGIMLPNHPPLVIAEQFGTLASLFPGRIDLGVGRAPGTDPRTMRALRRDREAADTFPSDVLELQTYLGPLQPGQRVQAVPGTGTEVPIWILGSSLFGAQLAAQLGMPYAFASHFAPAQLFAALRVYHETYRPSPQWPQSYAMAGVNVVCAPTDDEARYLFTSVQQAFATILRGTRGKLQPPIPNIEEYWSGPEKAQAQSMLACSFVGSQATVSLQLKQFVEETGADEVMVASAVFDPALRARSYELLAEATGTDASVDGF